MKDIPRYNRLQMMWNSSGFTSFVAVMTSLKRSMLVSMILGIGFMGVVSAYFEDRYFCVTQNSSITVSLGTGEQFCFVLLAELQQEIDDVSEELQAVERHLEVGRDPVYRGGVQTTLQKKLDELVQRHMYMRIAVEDYEKDLFIRVKSIVSFYVKPVYEEIMTKIEQSDVLLTRTMLIGDMDQYKFITENMQEYYYMQGIIERIKDAKNFSELLPFVKIFVGERAPEVTPGVLVVNGESSMDHGVSEGESDPEGQNNESTEGATGDIILSGDAFLPRDGSRK